MNADTPCGPTSATIPVEPAASPRRNRDIPIQTVDVSGRTDTRSKQNSWWREAVRVSSKMFIAILTGSLVISTALFSMDDEREKGSGFHASDTVDYFSGGVHYTIPKSLNPAITRFSEKHNHSALSLMLSLPDLTPIAPHSTRNPGWNDLITLLFEHGPRASDYESQLAFVTNMPPGAHTPSQPTSNGCDLYRTPLFDPGNVYVCPIPAGKLVVSCSRSTGAVVIPYPSCTVFENISDDLSLIYTYGVEHVDDAALIDHRVRALVSSFNGQSFSSEK